MIGLYFEKLVSSAYTKYPYSAVLRRLLNLKKTVKDLQLTAIEINVKCIHLPRIVFS